MAEKGLTCMADFMTVGSPVVLCFLGGVVSSEAADFLFPFTSFLLQNKQFT